MAKKYHLQLTDPNTKGYLVNTRRYCANTEGINAFMEQIEQLEGAIVCDLPSMKEYLKELIASINKQYQDSKLSFRWIENWHGHNCSGFFVSSNYAFVPVCSIYFIGIKRIAVISQRTENGK